MKIAFLPVYPNPYQRLLRDALLDYGVSVELLDQLPDASWLAAHQGQIDILHYHWLDGLYMNRLLTPLQAIKFSSHLNHARKLGYRMVWTAHNILPHKMVMPQFHAALHQKFIGKVDGIITHCDHGRRQLLARFPTEKPVTVIPHGHYREVYPMDIPRSIARERLNIPPANFVYLAVGNIVGYKGLNHLVEAFGRQARPSDVLVIAGRNRDKRLVAKLQAAAARDSRIRIYPRFIPEDEMQLYMTAADVMVAPFTDILTSGSVIAALSFDLPIIAPALGCLPELVSASAGILYQPDHPNGLESAMRDIRNIALPDMRMEAHRIADTLAWDSIGRKTADFYKTCLL